MPLVSIILPVRNAEIALADAVRSIREQTFANWELIIIDDASFSGTRELAESLEKTDGRIFLKRFDEHIGVSRALNYGIKMAKGEFIARHDADDQSDKYRLEKQLERFEKGCVDVLGTWAHKIVDGAVKDKLTMPVGHKAIIEKMWEHNSIIHGSVMFRRELINENGGYDEDLSYAQDWDLWLRLMFAGAMFDNLPETFYLYTFRIRVNTQERFRECVKLIWEKNRGRRDEWQHLVKLASLSSPEIESNNSRNASTQ